MSDSSNLIQNQMIKKVPILPLKNVVVFPHILMSLSLNEEHIKALEATKKDASDNNRLIVLSTYKSHTHDKPSMDNIYPIGTLANILPQGLKSAQVGLIVLQRCTIIQLEDKDGYCEAEIIPLDAEADSFESLPEKQDWIRARAQLVLDQFEQYLQLTHHHEAKSPREIIKILSHFEDLNHMTDMIAMQIRELSVEDKQTLLALFSVKARLKQLSLFLEKILTSIQLKKQLYEQAQEEVKASLEQNYKEHLLRQIRKKLDEAQETESEDEQLRKKIEAAKMPPEAYEKAISELNKLKMTAPTTAEATVSHNYLDTLISVPWHQRTKENGDLKKARTTLNKDHYGLETVKERIIEFLAVQKRVKKLKGPILCFVGPPGVGKTSLGESIASAMGRKFVRMALGGIRDEAEIRGHRRTYIGAMPGQIMQKMIKSKVKNPLFMLDEIDKMLMDFRGDPSSALLEVLDPEQNHNFNDHYLDVNTDLSQVLFIATANTLNIPEPLLDRMEIIRLSGYTEDEKMHIARKYLIPKQKKQHGLKKNELVIEDSIILNVIRYYTVEAGVRNLEREIAKICRKVVIALSKKSSPKEIAVTPHHLEKYLGIQRFRYGLADQKDQIGQVTGLAWTAAGGELLTIESVATPGKGKINQTGHLGEIMQESIQTAFTVVKSRGKQFNIPTDLYEKLDLHIHVPEGATPKDGPSAGIGMCTALLSTLTRFPVRADVAMTGEITLSGKILPIGGLKEKLLAAHRGGIKIVIIPEDNKKDLQEIPKNILADLTIQPVQWIDEALGFAFRTPITYHPAEL